MVPLNRLLNENAERWYIPIFIYYIIKAQTVHIKLINAWYSTGPLSRMGAYSVYSIFVWEYRTRRPGTTHSKKRCGQNCRPHTTLLKSLDLDILIEKDFIEDPNWVVKNNHLVYSHFSNKRISIILQKIKCRPVSWEDQHFYWHLPINLCVIFEYLPWSSLWWCVDDVNYKCIVYDEWKGD